MACLDHIIGLSRTECPCLDDGKPIDASESKSGLYLDEMPHINPQAVAASGNACVDWWPVMQRAREYAIRDMRTDVLVGLRNVAEPARKTGIYTIGDTDAAHRLANAGKPFAGMQMRTAPIRGGSVTVKRIGLLVDTTAEIPVALRDETGLEVEVIVSTTAGRLSWVDVGEEVKGLASILWDQALARPYNTRIHCGCTGRNLPTWGFNSFEPNSAYQWAEWVQASGAIAADPTGPLKADNSTFGVVVEIVAKCDSESVLCTEDADWSDPIMQEQARAVADLAASYLLSFVKSSTNVNRYVLLEGEQLLAHASAYKDAYYARLGKVVELLGQNVTMNSDCLACKDAWGFKVSTTRP